MAAEIKPGQIKPGQWVSVKVTAEPQKEAGRKTMVRLFRQDTTVAEEHRAKNARRQGPLPDECLEARQPRSGRAHTPAGIAGTAPRGPRADAFLSMWTR